MVFTEPDTKSMSSDEKTATQQVIAWASGQPFNNVLLSAILGAIGWCGYWAITIAVPAHLKQIQDGYQRIQDENRQLIERMDAQHYDERKQILSTYDRWIDRQTGQKHQEPAAAGGE